MTLSFSDEEWLGLDTWQKELYRTVMRDTMELASSLGYMFLRREEPEGKDSPENEETALESVVIQTPETPLTQKKVRVPGEITKSFISSYSERSALPTTAVLPCRRTTVIQKCQVDAFTGNNLLTSGAQATLGEERSDPPIHVVTPESKSPSLMTGQRTEIITGSLKDATSFSCGSGVDLLMEGDRTVTCDVLPDSEVLTVIAVEEINVAIESAVMPIHGDGWETHYCTDPQDKEEHWHLQGGSTLPPTLTGPQDTTHYYSPWTEEQGKLQWTEQISSASGQCVADGGQWVALGDCHMSTPESFTSDNFYKCSMCSKSFLQSQRHHGRLRVEEGTCPTCYRHLTGDLQEPAQHLPPLLREDSTHQPSQDKPSFRCPKCNRSFSRLVRLHRHQKTHAHNKTSPKGLAPPQRKLYKGPTLHAMEMKPTRDSSGETYSKLHRHLQLSTAFLQQLITSTCGFQYD
ncbi:uncharacterized protein LOC142689492 [Rhinoderma darwinii]|uniref:uncharacterized protein LOC142689492 n=1 Tax=Rhinoderma darwinii TaxID=43563 RepID=UPI003F66A4FE